ncbi:MAG: radical SAM family heme chaperone HemW [Lautropia sp.]|nr:radical SAM family heme chaperone HemW [Lautropia sp.]
MKEPVNPPVSQPLVWQPPKNDSTLKAAPIRLHSSRQVQLSALPPLSLYVHLPWCIRKCPYCDFNSHQAPEGGVDENAYLSAVEADLDAALPLIWGRRVVTVFIGGGTPSLFSGEGIDRLLSSIRARLPLLADAEVTMEANPGTFERARFADFRAAGVNRLSLGIQSFSDERLKALGRVHDSRQARAAAEAAGELFETFNLDLMYALPGQDLDGLKRDLAEALAFEPPHMSWYHLTLEPNTLFARFPPPVPDDDLSAEMQDAIVAALSDEYENYEVSAWARSGHRAQHNLNYWTFGDYLGIGAGAHGKISFPDRIVRQARYKHPRRYMETVLAGNALEIDQTVAGRDLPFEFMLNALRLREGVPVSFFEERTGLPLSVIRAQLRQAVERGLLEDRLDQLVPTAQGRNFLNDLLEIFLPER